MRSFYLKPVLGKRLSGLRKTTLIQDNVMVHSEFELLEDGSLEILEQKHIANGHVYLRNISIWSTRKEQTCGSNKYARLAIFKRSLLCEVLQSLGEDVVA